MKEIQEYIANRADLRPSEILGMAGATTAIASAIFLGRFEWSGDVVHFSAIFAATAAVRDMGCRTIEVVFDKIAQRKEKKVVVSNGMEALGVK